MSNGITGLREGRLLSERNRRRAMAGEPGYATIGPQPSWAERIAAQIRSAPRRIDRALTPETAKETAAVVGASLTPGISTAVDAGDLLFGIKNREPLRATLAALGFLIPGISGAAVRRGLGSIPARLSPIPSHGPRGGIADLLEKTPPMRRIEGPAIRVEIDGEEVILTAPGSRSHMEITRDLLEAPGGISKKDILRRIDDMYMLGERRQHGDIFGFVDSSGKFVSPGEAGAVAYSAGQIPADIALDRSVPLDFLAPVDDDPRMWIERIASYNDPRPRLPWAERISAQVRGALRPSGLKGASQRHVYNELTGETTEREFKDFLSSDLIMRMGPGDTRVALQRDKLRDLLYRIESGEF